MRLLCWRKRRKPQDDEIEQTRERVARTARIIAEQRAQVDEVVRSHEQELKVNHLAERVRWALRENPR